MTINPSSVINVGGLAHVSIDLKTMTGCGHLDKSGKLMEDFAQIASASDTKDLLSWSKTKFKDFVQLTDETKICEVIAECFSNRDKVKYSYAIYSLTTYGSPAFRLYKQMYNEDGSVVFYQDVEDLVMGYSKQHLRGEIKISKNFFGRQVPKYSDTYLNEDGSWRCNVTEAIRDHFSRYGLDACVTQHYVGKQQFIKRDDGMYLKYDVSLRYTR
ncbi:MAG: hypothetical protein ACRCXZ_08590 [Patescibacteria group bacterium]